MLHFINVFTNVNIESYLGSSHLSVKAAEIISARQNREWFCCRLPWETQQSALFPLLFQMNHEAPSVCGLNPGLFYSIPAFQRMHTARSPSSIPTGVSGDALDLSLSGSQLSMSKRPSSASPGKYFSRSVSVSVASESRGKRNTLVSTCTAICVLKHLHIIFSGCRKDRSRTVSWVACFRILSYTKLV